ncbi:MAG: hypothetical protein CMM92_07000 [Rickettsiales bacterium]|nr:hypothetical protein [Rickettsiales bacterium]RPG12595.1 MAG: aminotransferase class V-fold PLP-dependent enzyme [Pelagibacteraceae bacterium TMED195]
MNFINFNNAGASLLDPSTKNDISKYLQLETKISGYYIEQKKKKFLDKFYFNAARLLNCKPKEISFLQSTTYGWNLFINSLTIKKNSNIIIFDNEYGSNYITLINNNLNVRVSKLKENGEISFEDLKKKIDKHTVLISVCHIASQCGNILDVDKLGRFIKKINSNIIYLIDACQTAGHLKLNVKKNMCDGLVCSGRKYLRGPRGTGLIFIKDSIQKKIIPKIIDITKSKIIGRNISIINRKNIFETFEYSPSLKIGLSKAIEKFNKLGHKEVELKIKSLSKYFRKKISSNPLVTIYENEKLISGINTFSIKGKASFDIYYFLRKKRIITSISSFQTSTHYFKKKDLNDILRVSFHHFNKKKEVDYLVSSINNFTKKIK